MVEDLNSSMDNKLTSLFNQLEAQLGDQFNSIFIRKKYKKGAYLLRQGETSENYFFLEKGGIARIFIENGEVELTAGFIFPYEFGGCLVGSLLNQPACYTIRLLTDTYVRIFSRKDYEGIKQKHTVATLIEETIIGNSIQKLFNKSNEFRYLTAKERYFWLINSQPHLISYIPMGYIAQYLGVTAECLSRIRADIKSMPVYDVISTTELVLAKCKSKKKH